MKKKLFCILLSLCMLLCFMPQAAWADPVTGIKYLDWDADSKVLVEKTLTDSYATVTASDTEWNSQTAGWYVVDGTNGNITISGRVTVTGDVNLLLKDSCNLTVNGGISVPNGNSLTIYAQSNDDSTMGKLEADARNNENCAGIGGDNNGTNTGESGTITINGGKITAKGGESGAGIGCGNNKSYDTTDIKITNDTITINGGNITATGGVGSGAGIGGGKNGNGSYITINGGKVEATGGGYGGGAGIGGGKDGDGSYITISGGSVIATSGYYAAGIGGGGNGDGSYITISGGAVQTYGSGGGAGIGGGKNANGRNITISGGTVISKANNDGGAGIGGGQDGNGSKITISGGTVTATTHSGAGIGGGSGYGWSNIANGTEITISGGTVTARCLGVGSAGIGGGKNGKGSNITISGNSQVKVQVKKYNNNTKVGAFIGNGATDNADGTESGTFTDLTANGWVKYYSSTADVTTGTPTAVRHYGNIEKHDISADIEISELNNATCTAKGSVKINCSNSSCGEKILEIPALGHTLTHIEAKSATYSEAGNIEYWKCSVCNACFTDEHGTQPIDEPATVIPKLRIGYTFEGWYTDAALTIAYDQTKAPASVPLTLYPKWTPIEYSITYNLNEGSLGSGVSNPEKYTIESDDITLNNPKKAGYTFIGWTGTNGTSPSTNVSVAQSSTGNRTYTAHWTENSNYTIAFDTAGGRTIDNKTSVKWTGKVLEGITDPTRDGYNFTGWKYNDNGVTPIATYASLVPEDNATNNTITLVAQWDDSAAPVIADIENNGSYYVGQQFTVKDDSNVTVTVNNTEVTAGKDGKYTLNTTGENKICVTDAVGNKTEYTVTISVRYGGSSKKSQTVTDEQKQAELEKAAAEKKAAEIAEVKTTTAGLDSLKARSLRTAKGNVKVVAKLSSAEKAKVAEFKELGYTVKYRFYRSPKKSSGYKAMLTGTTGIYYNTYGEAGTRYYYKVQIRVYDADGALIAKTELKDCKYATRIF